MTDINDSSSPDTYPTDHRGLRLLGFDECLKRIAEAVVGRIGFSHDGEIVILPVNHVLDGMDIVFRTSWGSKLEVASAVSRAAFEVDGYDAGFATGWSVLVRGSVMLVDDAEDSRHLDEIPSRYWLPGDEDTFWVRIRPDEITGREIIRRVRT